MIDQIKKLKSNILLIGKRSEILSIFPKDTIKNKVIYFDNYNFTIDNARALKTLINKSDSNQMLVIISFFVASIEAQNAILKTLEDYTQYQFVIVVENVNSIIPTVRSRLIQIENDTNNKHIYNNTSNLDTQTKMVQDFIKMSPSARLKDKNIQSMIEKRIDKDDDKSAKAKDDVHAFIVALISKLLIIYKDNHSKDVLKKINELNILANYVLKNGSSQKLIMEYICFSLSS